MVEAFLQPGSDLERKIVNAWSDYWKKERQWEGGRRQGRDTSPESAEARQSRNQMIVLATQHLDAICDLFFKARYDLSQGGPAAIRENRPRFEAWKKWANTVFAFVKQNARDQAFAEALRKVKKPDTARAFWPRV